jgi:hypothetical protein
VNKSGSGHGRRFVADSFHLGSQLPARAILSRIGAIFPFGAPAPATPEYLSSNFSCIFRALSSVMVNKRRNHYILWRTNPETRHRLDSSTIRSKLVHVFAACVQLTQKLSFISLLTMRNEGV